MPRGEAHSPRSSAKLAWCAARQAMSILKFSRKITVLPINSAVFATPA